MPPILLTPRLFLQAGDLVVLNKPLDISEHPGWMDDAVNGRFCTIIEIAPLDKKCIRVKESQFWFNEDWVTTPIPATSHSLPQTTNTTMTSGLYESHVANPAEVVTKPYYTGFCDTGPGGGPGGCGGLHYHKRGCPTAKFLAREV